MKKISLNSVEESISEDYESILLDSKIDFETKVERQPKALVYGKKVFGSYGDFSCIVGSSKSMKTVLKNAIIAAYKGGNSTNHFPELAGVNSGDKWILDLDTEQSPFHVKRNTNMIRRMVGNRFDNYAAFNLRKYSVQQRLGFLKWVLLESEYAGKVGLCCLDGAADLVNSVNDEVASYELAQTFMELTAEAGCHLITVLHKNSQGGKPTGHLGSAILKKAETVAFLKRGDDNYIKVEPKYTRNEPFPEFEFMLSGKALPYLRGEEPEDEQEEDDDLPF